MMLIGLSYFLLITFFFHSKDLALAMESTMDSEKKVEGSCFERRIMI